MRTHTPGPWRINEHGITINGLRERMTIEREDGLVLADCGYASSAVARANTRLMAAAPKMRAVCEAVLTAWHAKPRNITRKEPQYVTDARTILSGIDGDRS